MNKLNLFGIFFITVVTLAACGAPEEEKVPENDITTSGEYSDEEVYEKPEAEPPSLQVTENELTEEEKPSVAADLDQELVAAGENVYRMKACMSCHTFGEGRRVGPDLLGVTERRDEEWLKNFIKNPDEMLRTDAVAKELLREYLVPMPNQGLTDEEVTAVVEYLKFKDREGKNN